MEAITLLVAETSIDGCSETAWEMLLKQQP